MFTWSSTRSEQRPRLQYSRDSKFPEPHTQTIETSWDFHTPNKPLEPGTWYWRVWSEGELFAGYSPIARVIVPAEAHRFTTPAVPTDQIAAMPHPRLIECAKINQPPMDEKHRASLIRSAKRLFEQGIPEHPGPHVAGDPRWPTWIDWYGKVANGTTGRTGGRLQHMAQYAMLTADPQMIEWTRQLAMDACKWDPEGGSAMRYGDIGAQHLLRGLNWCYDACREHMTPDEQHHLSSSVPSSSTSG